MWKEKVDGMEDLSKCEETWALDFQIPMYVCNYCNTLKLDNKNINKYIHLYTYLIKYVILWGKRKDQKYIHMLLSNKQQEYPSNIRPIDYLMEIKYIRYVAALNNKYFDYP